MQIIQQGHKAPRKAFRFQINNHLLSADKISPYHYKLQDPRKAFRFKINNHLLSSE
jgi:hypothetical protein